MTELTTTKSRREATGRLLTENGPLPFVLLGAAAGGWWLTARMTHAMVEGHSSAMSMGSTSLSFVAFLGGWVAMMGAMMFPAIVPVVLIFRRAAGRGQVAPTPYFVAGYLLVWATGGVPAYVAWRALRGPISTGAPLAGQLAGAIFLVAAAYQVSPLKAACLRHCRTPMSFFLQQRRDLRRPCGAARAGVAHGLACFGCCWALMAILVALGTMQLTWMVLLAALIFVEKVLRHGAHVARFVATAFAVLGLALLLHPALVGRLT